jgi:branched-chain amino acid transport system substrate-binding protein
VYTFVTGEFSQGQHDYIALINARGGIAGIPVEIETADTANDPALGLEAYERFKKDGAVLVDFQSTPVSNAVLPRAIADGMNVISAFSGRADAADGTVFPSIFPLTPSYWSQAALIVSYIGRKEHNNLKGKKITLVHIGTAFGEEPIPIFQKLAQKEGFTFEAVSYPSPGKNQSVQWMKVARDKPDWVVIWGAGLGQSISVKEALRNGIAPNKIVSLIWLSELDMQIAGAEQAKGIARFEGVASGRDLPVVKAIETEVIASAAAAEDAARVGTTYYNIGVATMALFAEGARLALESEGSPLTPAKLRKGFERIKNFTADGLLPPITVTSKDHQGGGQGRISVWDGQGWKPETGWFAASQDAVWELVRKNSAEFKAKGQ